MAVALLYWGSTGIITSSILILEVLGIVMVHVRRRHDVPAFFQLAAASEECVVVGQMVRGGGSAIGGGGRLFREFFRTITLARLLPHC